MADWKVVHISKLDEHTTVKTIALVPDLQDIRIECQRAAQQNVQADGYWHCQNCGLRNSNMRLECKGCKIRRR